MAFHPAPNLKLPEPLSGYTLIERLGRGGFGEVWKCEAPGGFHKAVKFVYGDLESDEDGRPAEQELKSLGRVRDIRHPYILTLERYDIIDGQLMVMMELADKNLWDRFRECRLAGKAGVPRDELLRYMHETAEALDLMNDEYKLQHLDIKPQNLFLVHNHVKVADFGLAKAFEGSVAVVTGGVTPVYAAPETFQGEVTRFSDQYSLGIVYQELLTGVRPFHGQNTKQLLLQHLREPPDLSSLPECDRSIIGRSMDKDPVKRWPSCKEMVDRLANAPHTYARNDARAFPLPASVPTEHELGPAAPQPSGAPATQLLMTQAATAIRGMTSVPADVARTALNPAARLAPTPVPPVGPGSRGWPGPGISTPLPGLVTPKMSGGRVVPTAPKPGVTLARNEVVETGRMGALGIAPPEKKGDGILFPAVVVGVGQTGLEVIRRLRRMIRDRFGKPNALPTVRFLFIDTDPEATTTATSGDDPLPLHEVALAKLNRPGHYLQRDGLPAVEHWLPPGLLYQLPKAPGPANGVRAFGRLALCDNYRFIAQRIRQQIEPFLTDTALDKTAAATALGVRSNRIRVYLTASLAGGTGGGMFLDLAYLFKHELRNVGYRNPEVYGLLLAPAADKSVSRWAAANTFAALAELKHYCGNKYQTRFDLSEPPLLDPNPPFERCGLVQWPRKVTPQDQGKMVGALARAAFLDLFTPVGERTDFVRSVAPVDRLAGPTVQPFGVFRLSWPRYELLSALTRRFCQQVLRRWTTKECTHLKEPIQRWLDGQWVEYRLDPQTVLSRFEGAVADALRGAPEAAFDAVVSTLTAPGAARVNGETAVSALDQLLKLVGKPEAERSGGVPALTPLIDAAAKAVLAEAEGHLSTVAVSFIEQPQYRLAGAEEALTQITAKLNATVERLEAEARLRMKEAVETFAKLFPIIGGLAGAAITLVGRRGSMTAELVELLAAYARRRYRSMLVTTALSVFRTLRDGVPEYMRDVSFCRAKLDALADAMGGVRSANPGDEPGAFVLPIGCSDLDQAADRFIASLPPDDLVGFEQSVQATVAKKFRGLVNVCLKAERADKFPDVLTAAARTFLDARLENANPAEALAHYRGTDDERLSVLEDAYTGASPSVQLPARPAVEATILAVPDGPDGEKLRELVSEANPGVEFIPARLPDDILVYREYPRIPIDELPQLGTQQQQAYQSMVGTDKPPHARIDVDWQPPVPPAVT